MGAVNKLISKMTAAERRYTAKSFRLHKSKGSTRVHQLYKLLLQSPELEDDALYDLLDYRSKSQLSTDKNYLYKFCLKQLRNFERDTSDKFRLMDEIQEANILAQKGMEAEAKKKLRAARKVANRKEFFAIEMLMVNELTQQFYKLFPRNEWIKMRHELWETRVDILEKQKQTNIAIDWLMQINEIKFIQGAARTDDMKAQLKQMLEKQRVEEPAMLLTDRIKLQYHSFRRSVYDLLGDAHGELYESACNVEIARKNDWKRTHSDLYILHMFLYCDTYSEVYDRLVTTSTHDELYDFCREEIRIYERTAKQLTPKSLNYIFAVTANDIQLAAAKKDVDLLAEAVKSGGAVVEKYGAEDPTDYQQLLLMLLSAGCIALKKSGMATEYLSFMQKAYPGKHRQDIYHLCMVLELVAHFEIGDESYVNRQAQNYLRYLDKSRNAFRSEKLCLRYLRKLANAPKLEEYREKILAELDERVAKLEVDSSEMQFYKIVNIRTFWLQRDKLLAPS